MARVLVVDDNADLLTIVGQVLRDAGHAVTTTNGGADAVCLLAGKPPPDLLLLDLVMPGFDGHKVLRALGPTAPPVIVVTGSSEIGDGEAASGKVRRVLTKPFDQAALLAVVADALAEPAPATPPAGTSADH